MPLSSEMLVEKVRQHSDGRTVGANVCEFFREPRPRSAFRWERAIMDMLASLPLFVIGLQSSFLHCNATAALIAYNSTAVAPVWGIAVPVVT
jgi:hypothetical protein